MKILFMGTPDFAAAALKALVESGKQVIGAVTQPDKPKGRGHAMSMSAVKVLALDCGIPVYQPTTLKDGAFEDTLKELNPDLIVVAAYGKILPSYVIRYPRLGCINIHASLLPRWRGAAPIQRAIMEGDAQTGVTIMQMDEGLDTGDMLYKLATPIAEEDNLETLHDRLAEIGARALLEALPGIEDGSLTPVPQSEEGMCYAKKIEKEDCEIDFSRPCTEILLQIRGLSPMPLAFARKGEEMVKIASAQAGASGKGAAEYGRVLSLAKGKIEVACGDGSILLTEVVPQGRKRMKAADWINGRGIAVGDLLGKASAESEEA